MLGILWMICWCKKLLRFVLIRASIPGNEQIKIAELTKPTPDWWDKAMMMMLVVMNN